MKQFTERLLLLATPFSILIDDTWQPREELKDEFLNFNDGPERVLAFSTGLINVLLRMCASR